jgi:hypothetical protein
MCGARVRRRRRIEASTRGKVRVAAEEKRSTGEN